MLFFMFSGALVSGAIGLWFSLPLAAIMAVVGGLYGLMLYAFFSVSASHKE